MGISEPAPVTPVHHALDGFATSLDHLVKVVEDGGLADLDDVGLVGFVQELERVRNRIALVDHAVVTHAQERDLPGRLCQRSMTRVLTAALRLSTAEANRRVRAAEQLGPRRSMTGVDLPILRPHLAAAQRDGDISTGQVEIIDRELRRVDGRGFDPGDLDAGERILADAAHTLGPEQLRGVAVRVVDAIDPDGTLPDDEHHQVRRYLHLRTAPDGSLRGDFRLTPDVGHKFRTVLDSLAAAQHTAVTLSTDPEPVAGSSDGPMAGPAAEHIGASQGESDGVGNAAAAPAVDKRYTEPDERTREQRLHDALGQLCDRLLRSGTLPDTGGIPTTLLITIDADQLASRTGHGAFADGTPITARQVATIANQAGIAWCVRGSRGELLTLGRTRRLATPGQTLALAARDGGCSFPGCHTEPAWCERHHIVSWIDGGPTDLTNLTLLCRYHHHNFEQRGWTCHITTDGLPAWIPPRWIDPHQQLIINTRIRVRHRTVEVPLRRRLRC